MATKETFTYQCDWCGKESPDLLPSYTSTALLGSSMMTCDACAESNTIAALAKRIAPVPPDE